MNTCQRCAQIHGQVVCSACWGRHWESRCFKCGKNPQWLHRGVECGRFCWSCSRVYSDAGRDEALREEVAAYDSARSRNEAPTGTEPALQGLLNWLPADPAAPPLPAYSATPEALSPVHCRLCLADCSSVPPLVQDPPQIPHSPDLPERGEGQVPWDDGSDPPAEMSGSGFPMDYRAATAHSRGRGYSTGVHPRVVAHLLTAHPGVGVEEYRRRALGDAVARWPEVVPAQVLRSRLAAYATLHADVDFQQGVCAVCARWKRRSRLREAVFPARGAAAAPAWLSFSAAEWQQRGVAWWDAVDDVLDVERYLQRHFRADDRQRDAEAAMVCAEAAAAAAPGDPTLQAQATQARLWHERVVRWCGLQREALRVDAVPVPGAPDRRWLLYSRGPELRSTRAGIECSICRRCASSFGADHGDGAWNVRMPALARAAGLWQGIEPPEIRALTYTERRVLRLARVDACVKRVAPHVVPWAATNEQARPQYTTRNVVAFVQDPDAIVQLCCVDPVDLSKTVCVQFSGPDATVVVRDTSLQVDLDRLRAAMWWFATNNWQWLEATRDQVVLAAASLGERMEKVLAAYACSLGGARRGVPRELLEAATRISEESVPAHLPGPADATAEAAAEVETDTAAAGDSSAAILDTGREDVSSLRLCNEAIRK